ncbi:immune-associated nucleotide-binding protein 1-like [Salvia hispanica]|uniref:immune-associated nucleotide-binding protein 1-like n=1 Tax=Salvia hispanica TaxID=49212 RepID=UPI002009A385|nr:immune-associated nucleotide-binding protein 1-like [Salvia hispanica]
MLLLEKMGGGDSSSARTVVLLGKMGNGKSATANSLLGHDVFESMPSLGGVTSACSLHSTVLPDQRILNVIDTPGLFDSTVESNTMAKEIAKCITLAKDGIHAVLLVLSLRSRFSQEEASAFECLCQIFGPKIADYMIVVFAHGDVLRKKLTLDDFLADNCPDQLKDTLKKCGNRTIVFDNWTEDEDKIDRQREELLSLVDTVLEENGGTPYTDELFQQIKIDEAAQGKSTENEISVGGLVEMIESRLKESISNLEKSLAEERAARVEAHMKSLADMAKAEHELNELRERWSQASHRSWELQEQINRKPNCVIL